MGEPKRSRASARHKQGTESQQGLLVPNINSDDILSLGALGTVAAAPIDADAVCGSVEEFSEAGRYSVENTNITLLSLLRESAQIGQLCVASAGCLSEARNNDAAGRLRRDVSICFRFRVLVQILEQHSRFYYTGETLAHFRLHEASKSCSWNSVFSQESIDVRRSLGTTLRSPWHRAIARREARRRELHIQIASSFSAARGTKVHHSCARIMDCNLYACIAIGSDACRRYPPAFHSTSFNETDLTPAFNASP